MKASTDRPAGPRPGPRGARVRTAAVFAVHGAVAGSLATRIPWIVSHPHISDGSLGTAQPAPAVMGFVSDAASPPVSFAPVALLTLSLVFMASVLRPSGTPAAAARAA